MDLNSLKSSYDSMSGKKPRSNDVLTRLMSKGNLSPGVNPVPPSQVAQLGLEKLRTQNALSGVAQQASAGKMKVDFERGEAARKAAQENEKSQLQAARENIKNQKLNSLKNNIYNIKSALLNPRGKGEEINLRNRLVAAELALQKFQDIGDPATDSLMAGAKVSQGYGSY